MLWLMTMLMACDGDADLLEERVAYLEWLADEDAAARDAEIAQLETDVATLQAAVTDAEARIAELEPLVDDALSGSEVYWHTCEGTEGYSHTWEDIFDSEAPTHATLWSRLDDEYDAVYGGGNSPWQQVEELVLLDGEAFGASCSWYSTEGFSGFIVGEYALVIN